MKTEPAGVAFIAVVAFMVGVAVGLLIGEFPARRRQAGYPERMADNTPTFTQSEPVATGEAIKLLLLAVIPVLKVFNIADLSADQITALLGLYAAVSVVVAVVVRHKVSPTPTTPPADRGESLIAVLVVAVAMIVCVWLIVTKS